MITAITHMIANRVLVRTRRRRILMGPPRRAAAAVTSPLTCLPPSRALRWLRVAGPRRRDTAAALRVLAAFGPAPAASSPSLTILRSDQPQLHQADHDHDHEQDDPVQGTGAEL